MRLWRCAVVKPNANGKWSNSQRYEAGIIYNCEVGCLLKSWWEMMLIVVEWIQLLVCIATICSLSIVQCMEERAGELGCVQYIVFGESLSMSEIVLSCLGVWLYCWFWGEWVRALQLYGEIEGG